MIAASLILSTPQPLRRLHWAWAVAMGWKIAGMVWGSVTTSRQGFLLGSREAYFSSDSNNVWPNLHI